MSNTQVEIEKELFEQYDKNLNKFFSLMSFVFIIFGLYLSIVSKPGIKNQLDKCIYDPVSSLSILLTISFFLCLLSIILAFFVVQPQINREEYRVEKKNGIIQFRCGEELKTHNIRLLSLIKKQDKYYENAMLLITCSLFASFNFFVSPYLYSDLLILPILLLIVIFILFVASICILWKNRKYGQNTDFSVKSQISIGDKEIPQQKN